MIASDSQAMGRIGEVICRTWQTAHKMKVQRGPLSPDPSHHDNFRAKRYVAKYTINPAITHGISHEVGSIEVGKLADLAVIEGNPLENIRLTEKVRYTILNGRIYDAATMNQIGNHPAKRRPFFWEAQK